MENSEGLKLTLEIQPTAMKLGFPSTTEPTNTIGMGYSIAASVLILILSMGFLSFCWLIKNGRFNDQE
jgi:hypothetical protein